MCLRMAMCLAVSRSIESETNQVRRRSADDGGRLRFVMAEEQLRGHTLGRLVEVCDLVRCQRER